MYYEKDLTIETIGRGKEMLYYIWIWTTYLQFLIKNIIAYTQYNKSMIKLFIIVSI